MEKLKKGEQKVYDYLVGYIDENGYPPSVRDIAGALGFASTSTVHLYLSRLEDKGYIEREQRKSRSFRPTAAIRNGIPLLGRVHAGLPVDVYENIDEYIDPSASLPYPRPELFALKVVGDSMVDVGIFENDIVIVHKNSTPANGDTVVAMTDGSVTVKTFYRENGHIRLQPENKSYKPIISKDVTVLGVVVTLIRKFI